MGSPWSIDTGTPSFYRAIRSIRAVDKMIGSSHHPNAVRADQCCVATQGATEQDLTPKTLRSTYIDEEPQLLSTPPAVHLQVVKTPLQTMQSVDELPLQFSPLRAQIGTSRTDS